MDIFEAIAQVKTTTVFDNVIIKIFHNGEPVQPDYLKVNPHLAHLFPTNEAVKETILEIKTLADMNDTRHEIIISEFRMDTRLI